MGTKNFSVGMAAVLVFTLSAVGFCCGDAASDENTFVFPKLGVSSAQRAVLLAIDNRSLPLKRNLCYYLSKPTVRGEPVLAPSRDNPKAPDYMAAHFYGSVVFDGQKYHMWYYAVNHGAKVSDLHQGPVCYARSDDGITWTKPNLGQVEFKGSRDNNALAMPDGTTQSACVILDPLDPDPARRYKMVCNVHNGRTWVFRTATSPNATDWKFSPRVAINEFIEISSFYRHNGLFVVNGQDQGRSEGGGPRGRQGYAVVSPDFENWLDERAEAFLLTEPADPKKRGGLKPYDQVHLGVGGHGLGNVVVGLYGMWHNHPGDSSRKIPASWFGFSTISCDLGLVVSNDGLHFREPVKGLVYLSQKDSPVTPVPEKPYPTILCQAGNGILNVGDETRIYHGRWRNAKYGLDYWGEVGLATLPRDRWGALGLYPSANEGTVWSAAVTLPKTACEMRLNADGALGMTVEVADERFQLLPDFSGDNRGVVEVEKGLDCPVKWLRGDLSKLAGQTVRFRILLAKSDRQQPRLFAVNIATVEPQQD